MRWRCRRGMKELDLLLVAWLERCWPDADAGQRLQFARFLELPDPQIAGYLLRDDAPEAGFEPLVRQLRAIR